jgi:Nucleoside H+ symporter
VAVIPLSFYNAYCNNFLVEANARVNFVGITFEPAAIQTLGQGSEFVFLLLLPLLLVRVGIKAVLLCGMLAWAARYALFALGFDGSASNTGMLITGVLLHGICYDFFFVASQLYIEQRFDASARSRAQAFLVMINMGLGVMLGSNFANMVYRPIRCLLSSIKSYQQLPHSSHYQRTLAKGIFSGHAAGAGLRQGWITGFSLLA